MRFFIILTAMMPNVVLGQFNTVKRYPRPPIEMADTVWKKLDALTEQDNTLDSVAWEIVYQQFLKGRDEKDSIKEQPHFYQPLHFMQVTSPFGERFHPIDRVWKMHNGIDLKAYYEPVYAIADGLVKEANFGDKEGNYIVIIHGRLESIYCHLSTILCKKGQSIKGGECIGISGNSGNSTGPHLHFGIKVNGHAEIPWFLTK